MINCAVKVATLVRRIFTVAANFVVNFWAPEI
jgi:hypothetical protein